MKFKSGAYVTSTLVVTYTHGTEEEFKRLKPKPLIRAVLLSIRTHHNQATAEARARRSHRADSGSYLAEARELSLCRS